MLYKMINTNKAKNMPDTKAKLEEYIRSMNEKDHQGYLIAKSHLGSSFDLEKSLGYVEWLKKDNDNTNQ